MTALESFPGRESRGKCNVFHHVVVSQDKRNMRKSCLAAPYLSRLLRSEFFLPSLSATPRGLRLQNNSPTLAHWWSGGPRSSATPRFLKTLTTGQKSFAEKALICGFFAYFSRSAQPVILSASRFPPQPGISFILNNQKSRRFEIMSRKYKPDVVLWKASSYSFFLAPPVAFYWSKQL